MKIYFDSGDFSCKHPFGAVKTNETVCFQILICNDIYVEQVSLVSDPLGEYPFTYQGCENGWSVYRLELKIKEANAYFYYFKVETEQGIYIGKSNNGSLELNETLPCFQLTVYEEAFSTPSWAKGKIMYQIFPDRFAKSDDFLPVATKNERILHNNWNDTPLFQYEQDPYLANDYFGGNLKGIIEKLDYLEQLGVGIIYLNPVFESGENHRYSTADYKKIDPYLGTEKDFTDFTAACHKRGIRVILDGVFSHTGADSVYFNKYGHYDSQGAYQSQNSPYYSWYDFKEFPDQYESWWGFKNLPNVREDNEEYLDFITNPESGVLRYWHDRGVDGWRLDVADELPDVFIDRLRQTVKQLNPEALIIGEVWEDASHKESYGAKRRYLLGKQLDSVMNYPFRSAIIHYVKTNDTDAFIHSVGEILENYPEEVLAVLMNSLGTHDTVRILTELGVNEKVDPKEQGAYRLSDEAYEKASQLLKLATVLQFTLPGIPCIYYGDEVGLQGFQDPYCRKCYPYGYEDKNLLDFYKKITAFYKTHTDDFKTRLKSISKIENVLCFQRGTLFVYINAREETAFIKEGISGELVFYEKPILYNEYGMIIPPKSFAIIKREKDK